MRFGDILRSLLEEKDITQKQLAINLNIAVSTLGNYICNIREPDFETVKLFAAYFSVSTDYLLDYQSGTTTDHAEDELLRIFRSLPNNQRTLYLEQGRVFVRFNQDEV